MKPARRIGVAAAGAVASAAVFAVLLPHAREAGTLLMAQDDPVALSDTRINSALRTDRATIGQGAEQALKAGDADLAKSFVELAQDRGVVLPSGVSERVDAAVADENSTASMAKRFATGLVTGEAICVCSVTFATWCAKASGWRWARKRTSWCSVWRALAWW